MLCHIQMRLSDYICEPRKNPLRLDKKSWFNTRPTSSNTFSRCVGPAVIKDKVSNHRYLVDNNGAVKHFMLTSSEISHTGQ